MAAGLLQILSKVGPRLAQAADVASAASNVAATGARMMKARPGAEAMRGGYGSLGGARERLGRYGGQFGRAAWEAATGRWISSLRRSTNALNNWSLEVIGSMERLARYSPMLSLGTARLRFGRIRRDLLFARDVGPSATRVMAARNEFEEALRPLQTQLQRFENKMVSGLLKFGTNLLELYNEKMNELLKWIIPGYTPTEKEKETTSLLDKALEEAKRSYDRRERTRRRMS